LAAQACDGGKVSVNGSAAKPHKLIGPGDLVDITHADGRHRWRVAALAERRGPAATARTLYVDLTPPPPPKSEVGPLTPRRAPGAGRPTKRERRQLDRFR
jgi:ribosome-associated heat shock protein Hsp15